MFIHQHSLRHLLKPRHYCSAEHYEQELEHLFRPSWQFIATKSELPREGDFLTLELFGTPLLIRRSNGRYLAYENVCAHRHCLLMDVACGNQPKLKCQYHSWEYDDEGRTGRIPEAKCFRPWDRENSKLRMFPLESCGDLLFVSLRPEVTLAQWLDPLVPWLETYFTAPLWQMHSVWNQDCQCNWKVPIENTLESYHVTTLHNRFYGDLLPPEENSDHQMNARFSELIYNASSKLEQWQAKVNRWLGGQPTLQYVHRHLHPNTIFVTTDTLGYALSYLPTSARTVQIRMRIFAVHGQRRDPFSKFVRWGAAVLGRKRALDVFAEDLSIYDAQQKGLECSQHPGVIGSREERIYGFQKYVLDMTT